MAGRKNVHDELPIVSFENCPSSTTTFGSSTTAVSVARTSSAHDEGAGNP
jgi:hypothetical protein